MKKIIALILALITTVAYADPESGWWWNPQQSGSGFNIENQQGTLFIARFDAEGWYSGSTSFSAYNQAQDISMAEQSGSTIENLHITFKDRSHAQVTWKSETFNIERFNFGYRQGLDRLAGQWYIFVPDGPIPILDILMSSTVMLPPANGNDIGITGSVLDPGKKAIPKEILIRSDPLIEGYSYWGVMENVGLAFNFIGQDTIQGILGQAPVYTSVNIHSTKDSFQDLVRNSLKDSVEMIGFRIDKP